MARHLRVEYPGAIYHVTVRMLGSWPEDGCRLFRDNNDRERLLDRLAERVEQFNIRLYQVCLMLTHFHLVLETPEGNLSRFMHSLSTAYTVYYNIRHRRHGHLVDGRFKAKLVDGDEYLLALTRYVHQNPVCVGRMKKRPIKEKIQYLRRYRWSSYPSYIGLAKPFDFVEYRPILAGMAGKKRDRPRHYRKYVESGLAKTDNDFMAALKASPMSIGSEAFRRWVDEQYQKLLEKQNRPEDVSFRRVIEPLGSDQVLEVVGNVLGVTVEEFAQRRRNSILRGVAAWLLCKYAGLTQREAAKRLCIGTDSAVSRQIRKLKQRLAEDRSLTRKLRRIERTLEQMRAEQGGDFVKS